MGSSTSKQKPAKEQKQSTEDCSRNEQKNDEVEKLKEIIEEEIKDRKEADERTEKKIEQAMKSFEMIVHRMEQSHKTLEKMNAAYLQSKREKYDDMNYSPGYCVLINNSPRKRSSDTIARIEDMMKKMNFHVVFETELSIEEILQCLNEAAFTKETYFCVFVIIISTGHEIPSTDIGFLDSKKIFLSIKDVWKPFVDRNSSWKGKPKLFILQLDNLNCEREKVRSIQGLYPSNSKVHEDILLLHSVKSSQLLEEVSKNMQSKASNASVEEILKEVKNNNENSTILESRFQKDLYLTV